MQIQILKEEKNSIDIEIDNFTMVELLRVYLNKEGAKLAAWRREHPSKPAVLHIEAEHPKKLLQKAISTIEKELDKATDDFKKMK